MRKRVVIDAFPECARAYTHGYAVVAVDVIRATTSAITVVANGGRCFPVSSVVAARRLAAQLPNPVLAGEAGGEIAPGFDLNNSPARLALRCDVERPVILLSSSGTRLLYEARNCNVVYLACLRNWSYAANHLARHHSRVAVIGAGTRNHFREEDQLCCAWIAGSLLQNGYEPEDTRTENIVNTWIAEEPRSILKSESVEYLRRSGQLVDLGFILSHVDDLQAAFMQREGEIVMASAGESDLAAHRHRLAVPTTVSVETP